MFFSVYRACLSRSLASLSFCIASCCLTSACSISSRCFEVLWLRRRLKANNVSFSSQEPCVLMVGLRHSPSQPDHILLPFDALSTFTNYSLRVLATLPWLLSGLLSFFCFPVHFFAFFLCLLLLSLLPGSLSSSFFLTASYLSVCASSPCIIAPLVHFFLLNRKSRESALGAPFSSPAPSIANF